MDLIPAAAIIESGLNATRQAFEIAVENMAHKDTTKGIDGTPYKTKNVSFESYMIDGTREGVRIASIDEDTTPGSKVYDPGHPHADEDGNVQQTNVSLSREMVKGMDYSRSNEVLSAIFNASKKMTETALMLGKQ